MGSVMNHPVFKADPIAAIRAHLEVAVAATEQLRKNPKAPKEKRNNKPKPNKKQGRGGKAAGSGMEA